MMPNPQVDVVVGENQVLIKCDQSLVDPLRQAVVELASYLDYVQPKRKLMDRMRFEAAQRALLGRLFPPVSVFGPTAQEFDARWGDTLRQELLGAAQRVLASLGDDGTIRYQLAAIDDWIRVLGQTRLLWVERSEAGDLASEDARLRGAGLFTWLQTELLVALRPELGAATTG
jgi:hypothetical protein